MSLYAYAAITNLLLKLNEANDTVMAEAEVLAEQAAQIGAEVARTALDNAVTDYGQYRMSIGKGNSAGRNDTGNMISKLDVQEPVVEEGYAAVAFGWSDIDYEEYFGYQENGTARIQGAFSLNDGQDAVINELPRLERNMKARISRKTKGQ